jgi:RHS repeat-associated protein
MGSHRWQRALVVTKRALVVTTTSCLSIAVLPPLQHLVAPGTAAAPAAISHPAPGAPSRPAPAAPARGRRTPPPASRHRTRAASIKGDAPPAGSGKVALTVKASTGQSSTHAARRASATAQAALPSPPFNECPAVGADTSCGVLIVIGDNGVTILLDPSQGPFDGSDDTLVGVLNSSSAGVGNVKLAATAPVFAFDGDGLCTFLQGAGCPFGPTGYEGPNTAFSGISADQTTGTVTFNGGLAPGTSGYFSLEVAITPTTFVAPGPTTGNLQGGGSPSMPGGQAPCQGAPVNCLNGEFWHTFTDTSVPGRGLPLDFTRTYSSLAAASNGPLGFGWTFSYNMHLAVDPTTGAVTVTEENGAQIVFNPASGGGYSAASFVVASLVKNADGTFTLTRGDQTRYTFSAAGQLLTESDRSGYTTTLGYTNGQLTTVTDPAGRQLTLTHDSSGRISGLTDPGGRTVSYSYDASANLQSVTDVGGGKTSFTYDQNHLLLTATDPRGSVLTNVYDSSNRVVSQTDPLGRKTTFSYASGASGPQTTITDPNGNVEVQQFQNNLLVSKTLGSGTPQAATWTYTYDPVSLGVTSVTDPNGHVIQRTFDANANMLSQADALGRTTSYTYDKLNDQTSVTDPLNVTTTMTYDAQGHLLTRSTPLAGTSQTATVTYTYGDASHPGDVTAITDANGNTTKLAYDKFGDVVRSADPDGNITTSTYDVLGRVTSRVSPNGNVTGANPAGFTTSYTYNAFGQQLTVTDPLGRKTTFTYDANQNETSVTDGNGHTTTYAYDADNELTKVTHPDGSTLTTARDANGNVTSKTDGLGHATTYAYDALNRKVSATDPLGHQTTYAYDPAGNLTSMVDAQSQTTSYSYDAANELTAIHYSDGTTPGVTLTYDADGQRASMTDGTGSSSYTYDSLHRLTQTVNGAGATVGYAYDLAGHLTKIVYPGGSRAVTRGYDAAGRLTSITDWLGNKTQLGYDADGNLLTESYPNGTSAHITYDAADQLSGIKDSGAAAGTFLNLGYSRDQIGLLSAENSTTYSYDSVGRLTSGAGQTYTYDAADRLTGFTDSQGNSGSDTFDAADELTSSKVTLTGDLPGTSTTTYSYDARGNRISQILVNLPNQTGIPPTTTAYGYDQADRLTSFSAKAKVTLAQATYAYDGAGLRASKTVSGTTEAFTWDLAEGTPLLLQDGGTSYVTGPAGLPLEQVSSSGTVRYYHQDQLGSTRALTDAGGHVVATYAYDPYGNLTATTGTVSNPFLFAGQFLDSESGLYYMRARYYDPAVGQFLTRDPLEPVTQLPYGYAADSPTNFTDPTGLDCGNSAELWQLWQWFYQNSPNIAAITGLLAAAFGVMFTTGVGAVLSVLLGVLSTITSVIAAVYDISKKQYMAAAFDIFGAVTGGAALGMLRIAKILFDIAEGTEALIRAHQFGEVFETVMANAEVARGLRDAAEGWQAASGALTSFAALVGGGAAIGGNGGLPLPGGGPAPTHCTPYGRFGCEPLR